MYFRCLAVCMCSWAEIVPVWSQNASRLMDAWVKDVCCYVRLVEGMMIFLREGGITPYILAQAVHFEFEVHWKGKLTTGKHAERSTNPPNAHLNVCVPDLSSSSGTWSSVWFDRSAVSGPKDTPLLTDRWGPEFLTLVSLTSPRVLLTGRGAEPVTMWVSATSHFHKKLIGTGSYGEFEKLCQPSTVQVPGGQEPQTIFLRLVLITK